MELKVGDKVLISYHVDRYTKDGEPVWEPDKEEVTVTEVHPPRDKDGWPENIVLQSSEGEGWAEDYYHVEDDIYDSGMEEVYRDFPSTIRIERPDPKTIKRA